MSKVPIYQEVYFVPEGRCKKLLMLVNRCQAKNQMWQRRRKRRQQFLDKVLPYLNARISKFVKQQGYKSWHIEHTGSKNLYDADSMQNQSYRIYMEK